MIVRRGIAALVLALLLVTCGAPPPAIPLNSERIEQSFGSYGVDVLYADARLRLSSLYSSHDGGRITRTLAIVGFPDLIDARLAGPHQAILGGASIGATLEAAGWTVVKRNLYFGEVTASGEISERMGLAAGTVLAAHAYVLAVTREGRSIDYATIAELHHPDYLDREALYAIYGEVLAADRPAGSGMRGFIDAGLQALAAADSAQRE